VGFKGLRDDVRVYVCRHYAQPCSYPFHCTQRVLLESSNRWRQDVHAAGVPLNADSQQTTAGSGSLPSQTSGRSVVVDKTYPVFCCRVSVCRQRAENKRLLSIVPGVIRRAGDHELATLRELPSVTVQTTNALYAHKYVLLASC